MGGVMRRIVLLGSTGSIGIHTLDVVKMLGGRIGVVGLSTNRDVDRLAGQIEEHRPPAVAVTDESVPDEPLKALGGMQPVIYRGPSGLLRLAETAEADLVVNALVGASGIEPTLAAIAAGKDVAIANKECLVSAGEIIVREARRRNVELIPVDSEHSAIHQCIKGEDKPGIKRIILTASGGPFIDRPADEIASVRALEALKHPTWSMGRKVTIDSATLLNKGFEVIEAHWLFAVDADRIDVLVERKSIVHSLVEFVDGSVMALLSMPDMRLPIQYALTYPRRLEADLPRLDLSNMGEITFKKPDREKFPCLDLAFDAVRKGGTLPAVLSAADEVAVEAFLEGSIGFGQIYPLLRDVVGAHEPGSSGSLAAVLEADGWARVEARRLIGVLGGAPGKC
jgi:1-deoxy-D-xylulose-5-phosphate reductoisomerase